MAAVLVDEALQPLRLPGQGAVQSWCTATKPFFEKSARLVLTEHLVQMAACVLGGPDFDLLISARLAAGNCQSASSEMLAMRQRRAAAEHDFSLLGKKKARNAG